MSINKALLLTGLISLSTISAFGQNAKQPHFSKKDSISYALGVDISQSLKSSGIDVDLQTLIKGLATAYQGGQLYFDEAAASQILQNHFAEMRQKQTQALIEPGQMFLTEMQSKPGVQSTPEGVLYEVLTPGEGRKPTVSDEVKVHYAGYLIDGTKFDSSYDRGEPIVLNLNKVIKGWTIALPLMNVGAKYKIYIPYELAYGERGSGRIPPYSTLIFEIELLDIIKPDGEA